MRQAGTYSPYVRSTSKSDRIDAAPRKVAQCQKATYAPQQTEQLFDHLVGAGEQRLGASMPSAFAICGARTAAAGRCQAPNTSLVPVYDRITFFGNSALRIS